MTIKTRIVVLLALLSLLSLGGMILFQQSQQKEARHSRMEKEKDLGLQVQQLVTASSRSLYRYLRNYASRPGMAEFLATGDKAWAEKYIRGRMSGYRIDSVWVLYPDGTVAYGLNLPTDMALTTPPAPLHEFEGAFKTSEYLGFFGQLSDGLYQILCMPITPASDLDRKAKPHGWLLVGKRWGEPELDDLANAGHGRITLTGPTHVPDVNPNEELEYWLPLPDHRNHPIAGLDYHVPTVPYDHSWQEWTERLIFFFTCGAIIIAVGLAFHFWIFAPLGLLRESLVGRDPAKLSSLIHRKTELGHAARVVQAFLLDQDRLKEALADRVKMGQELHDGVIQQIYGAGMTLSSVSAEFDRDPASARRLIVNTQETLNQVISELRYQIDRIEPLPSMTTFGEACTQLIQQLSGPVPLIKEIDIDEELAASLPAYSRREVLQFAREAISNALRHGHPTRLEVSWQRSSTGSLLTVADNGLGFDPQTVDASGRGLGNLSERAIALGGRVEIDAKPTEGSQVRLHLPPIQPPV